MGWKIFAIVAMAAAVVAAGYLAIHANKHVNGVILPGKYQKMLGTGIDVDWVNFDINYLRVAKDFRERGFNTVRIRIRECNTSEAYLHRIKEVVDASVQAGLVPVVAFNASEFKERPDTNTMLCTLRMWQALARTLKNEPYTVSYDLIIEPSEGLDTNCKILNEFYARAVREIRAIDPSRIIFIAPNHFSSPYYLRCLQPLKDRYLMAEWHFYAAGPRKHGKKNLWTTGTPAEKNAILTAIDAAHDWQKQTGIRTWVGAWMPGNYNHGNDYSVPEQVQFARFMTCALRHAGIPFAINAGKHFYNYKTYTWMPQMAPVLDAVLPPCTASTQSDFSKSLASSSTGKPLSSE